MKACLMFVSLTAITCIVLIDSRFSLLALRNIEIMSAPFVFTAFYMLILQKQINKLSIGMLIAGLILSPLLFVVSS